MKKLLLLLIVMSTTATVAQNKTSIEDLKWLTGEWKRTNNEPAMSGHEKWKQEENRLVGWGITMKGTDTAFVEKLQIIHKDNALYYVADVSENKAPVYFKFVSLTANGFVCENAANDFPRKIEYKKQGATIIATISGGGPKVDYIFEKI